MSLDSNINRIIEGYKVPANRTREEAWDLLESRMDEVNTNKVLSINRNFILRLAAAVVLAFIVAVGLYDSGVVLKSKVVADNNQTEYVLPDGSKVLLNPNSELQYRYSKMLGKRIFYLKGESLFSIEKGQKCEINFHSGRVEVLGTQFIISAYNDDKAEVNCLEGSVKVQSGEQNSVLTEGQQVEIENKELSEVQIIDNKEVLSEYNGNFAWKETSLDIIFEILSNRFGYKIDSDAKVLKSHFSGEIFLENIEIVMEILSLAMDFEYNIEKSSKTVIVESK